MKKFRVLHSELKTELSVRIFKQVNSIKSIFDSIHIYIPIFSVNYFY